MKKTEKRSRRHSFSLAEAKQLEAENALPQKDRDKVEDKILEKDERHWAKLI